MKNFAVKILAGCVCVGLCLAGLAGCGTEDKAPDIEVTTFPLPDGPEQSEQAVRLRSINTPSVRFHIFTRMIFTN